MDVQLHDYSKCLAADVRKRYIEKISKIDFIDPYLLKPTDLNYDSDVLPQVSYPDIVNYLLFAPSPMTGEQLKCYKSMDAYNYYLSGFVKKVGIKQFEGDICLVLAAVSHSQKLSVKPPEPWLMIEKKGRVLSAHCNCMAGLGEACSHVGAVLFYIDAMNKMKDSVTVTGQKAYWVVPSNVDKIQYKEVADIDFTNPDSVRKKCESSSTCAKGSNTKNKSKTVNPFKELKPTPTELGNLYERLSLSKTKPAILSIIPPHNDKYRPLPSMDIYPKVLSDLYDPKNIELNYMELLEKSKVIYQSITVNQAQQNAVEEITRDQS